MNHWRLTLDMIAAELGEELAYKFADHFAGERVSIPNLARQTPALATTLGDNAARILSERFGGSAIDVPTRSQHRRAEIARLRREGKNPAAIAHRVGCTQRYVCDVLAEEQYLAMRTKVA
jgi:hypothetical protein